jgi:PAS domain S-box-containing protein
MMIQATMLHSRSLPSVLAIRRAITASLSTRAASVTYSIDPATVQLHRSGTSVDPTIALSYLREVRIQCVFAASICMTYAVRSSYLRPSVSCTVPPSYLCAYLLACLPALLSCLLTLLCIALPCLAFHCLAQNEEARNTMAYCLSFSHDESEFQKHFGTLFPNSIMHEQLKISENQLRRIKTVDNQPLPQTLEDALLPTSRAIVITEPQAPFRIWNVNNAWENLCGYTYIESRGKTLGSLLKGPETNSLAATALIGKLLQGEEAGTALVNYTKTGRRFNNRVRVGPLRDAQSGTITHFVGILQEI